MEFGFLFSENKLSGECILTSPSPPPSGKKIQEKRMKKKKREIREEKRSRKRKKGKKRNTGRKGKKKYIKRRTILISWVWGKKFKRYFFPFLSQWWYYYFPQWFKGREILKSFPIAFVEEKLDILEKFHIIPLYWVSFPVF